MLRFRIEPVAYGKQPLVVVLCLTAIHRETALHEIVRANENSTLRIHETRAIGGRQRGSVILISDQNVETQVIGHISAQRDRAVGAIGKRAAEARVVRVGPQSPPGQAREGQSIELVQRVPGVAGAVAAAHVWCKRKLASDTSTLAPALAPWNKIFVQQSGADQSGIESRNVAQVVVVEIQFDAGMYLQPHGQKITAQSRAGRGHRGIAPRAVRLQRVVDG